MTKKLLITGANGKMGRAVSNHLVKDLGIDPGNIVLASRNTEALDDYARRGFEIRAADFGHPETLEAAFAGIDHLLLISIDAIGQREQLHTNAIQAAEQTGVAHLTYTSMHAPETSPVIFAHEHLGTERALANSQIPTWRVLRNSWYFENLPEFFANVLTTGVWMTAAGNGKSAQISRDDLALAAAASVAKGGNSKEVLTLNGPDALTIEEMARAVDAEIGTRLNVIRLENAALAAKQEEFGVPPEFVGMTVSFDEHIRQGLSDGDSQAFEKLTGKPPRSFAVWLKENRDQLLSLSQSRATTSPEA